MPAAWRLVYAAADCERVSQNPGRWEAQGHSRRTWSGVTLSRNQRERQAARSRDRRAECGLSRKWLQQVLSVGQATAEMNQPLIGRMRSPGQFQAFIVLP